MRIVLLIIILLGIWLLFTTTIETFAPGSLAYIAGASAPGDNCSMHCNLTDPKTGLPADPYDCCQCRSSNGVYEGGRDSENEPFRKCMCAFGTGYESYCYKLNTNFLLSQ